MSDSRPRDRGATEDRVLDAAAEILTREGAGGLGINALAKTAGCDKQLIYRYFGGLEGVMAALGERVAERLAETLDRHRPDGRGFAEVSVSLALGLLDAYRGDPLLARLRAAEWSAPGGDFGGFAEARGKVLSHWIAKARPSDGAPAGVDAAAMTALIVGAVEAVALSAATTGALAGVPLRGPADEARINESLAALVRAAFAPAEGSGEGHRP
jgi:AcrR family transcriptional regulator